ncbi:hypothetical protein GGR57DRAFT_501923 [Xylariaceae sp. FL1272]|nr:hypothetical protein GGR57DRAFT_501923 [Xylariaceae sp. FL1272]
MPPPRDKKYFSWGCTIPINPESKFPTSAVITHVRNCQCPGDDEEGIRMYLLERAVHIHESNVVKYSIPVVNNIVRQAAFKIGINLNQKIEELPMYRDKVKWNGNTCIEALGRGMTPKELEALRNLPRGQTLCSWVL